MLGPESNELIEQLKGLQDHLGNLVDAQVAIDHLQNILDKKASKKEELSLEGIGTYLEFKTEERDRLLTTFPEAWSQFNQPEFRRKLALALETL